MEQAILHALLASVLSSSGSSWLDWNQRRCSPQPLLRLAARQPLPWGMSLAPMSPSSRRRWRSEEHTSELQSRLHLVCRLLLEKKKTSSTIQVDVLVRSGKTEPEYFVLPE